MGLFSDPSKRSKLGLIAASKEFQGARRQTDPFYQQQLGSASSASSRLADFLGLDGQAAQQQAFDTYLNSPAFTAQLQSGTDAIDQSAIARGMSQSGAALKELQNYGQGLYAQDYGNHLSRLASMASGGYGAASGLTNNALQQGQYNIQYGQAADAGRQAKLGNVLGVAGTVAGFLGGQGGFGGGQGGGAAGLGRLFLGG